MSTAELAVVDVIEIDLTKAKQTEAPRKPYLCRHIFVDGHQCGARALRGQNFCYYHYAHRTPLLVNQRRRRPASSGFDLTRLDGLDNHTAIQLSICEVLGRIANNSIEPKRAWLLLYGLQLAGQNLRYARPNAEAPVPDSIVEDAALGQLAELEPGRPAPPSFADSLRSLLEEDLGDGLAQPADQRFITDSCTPEDQT